MKNGNFLTAADTINIDALVRELDQRGANSSTACRGFGSYFDAPANDNGISLLAG